jgi:hypothetical protein
MGHYFYVAPLLLLCLLLTPCGDPAGEVQWTEQTLARIQELRAKTLALQAELDELILALRERKVALAAYRPPPPPAFGGTADSRPDPPPAKKPVVRCAATTSKGERCSRPATSGQRYCSQHALTRSK